MWYLGGHMATKTYGASFDQALDGARIDKQFNAIKALLESCRVIAQWLTLAEIEEHTGYTSASISAQLRHLRKAKFGSHKVEKRRRATAGQSSGAWEYALDPVL